MKHSSSSAHRLDRSRPPAPGPLRSFSFPAFEHRRVGGRWHLYLAADDRTPLVHIELLTPGGGGSDPRDRDGLAALTGALLAEGTAARSSQEIAATAERLGGYLSSSADWDVASVSTTLLSPHLVAGLDLLIEVATTPIFPAREVERLKRRTLAELQSRRARPAAVADRALAAGLYGDAPYGRYVLGTEASVRAVRRHDVRRFHRRHGVSAGGSLIAVGDFDSDALAHRFEEALARVCSGEPPAPPEIEALERRRVEVRIVDRPSAAQTELRVGHVGIPRTHPDYIAATLMNAILGGKFTSRINLNLRERHGYTYGAHSRFARRLGPGPFSVSAAVANEAAAAAARETLSELHRIRDEPVADEELEDARNYLLGVFPYTVQTIEGVASRLDDLAVYGLADDYYAELPRRLASVSAAEVQRTARDLLRPDRALIVAVGPGEQLRRDFDPLGPVELVDG